MHCSAPVSIHPVNGQDFLIQTYISFDVFECIELPYNTTSLYGTKKISITCYLCFLALSVSGKLQLSARLLCPAGMAVRECYSMSIFTRVLHFSSSCPSHRKVLSANYKQWQILHVKDRTGRWNSLTMMFNIVHLERIIELFPRHFIGELHKEICNELNEKLANKVGWRTLEQN